MHVLIVTYFMIDKIKLLNLLMLKIVCPTFSTFVLLSPYLTDKLPTTINKKLIIHAAPIMTFQHYVY